MSGYVSEVFSVFKFAAASWKGRLERVDFLGNEKLENLSHRVPPGSEYVEKRS